jgi:hypothetical protein
MTVQELLRVAVRELVGAYHATRSKPEPVPRQPFSVMSGGRPSATENELETVWRPHRDARSLLGMRESKAR